MECPHCQEKLVCVLPSRGIYNLKLLHINDDVSITKIEFETEEVLAGRDYHVCKLVLKNEFTARQQSRFIFKNLRWYIMDMNSLNGTYVNGSRLKSNELHELKCNDLISFANREKYIFISESLTSKLIMGPTSNGAYAIEFFYDKDGNVCYEELAYSVHIHEYDENGKFVLETIGNLNFNKTERNYDRTYPYNKTVNFENATIYAPPDITHSETKSDDSKDVPCVYASPDIMQ